MITKPSRVLPATLQREQLRIQRRQVDFDTYDVTVDELLRRVARNRIDIAPIYQRKFRWDDSRQSRLIESVLLGIPVPPLFMATNTTRDVGSVWEVVDGLQRLLTLVNFAGDEAARRSASLEGQAATLTDLEKLTEFERASFLSLPKDVRQSFEDRPLKVIVLNDKSDLEVRFDLFERLNTGGVVLSPHEIRQSVYRGPFIDGVEEMARNTDVHKVVVLPVGRRKDGTLEDFVLRFFAFLHNYQKFDHSVKDFLNEFTDEKRKEPVNNYDSALFSQTFAFLARCFPSGLKSRKGATPVNLFEAVSVGAALALKEGDQLKPQVDPSWLSSDELRAVTTGATNSRPKVRRRIEYCRDMFLELA